MVGRFDFKEIPKTDLDLDIWCVKNKDSSRVGIVFNLKLILYELDWSHRNKLLGLKLNDSELDLHSTWRTVTCIFFNKENNYLVALLHCLSANSTSWVLQT